VLPKRTLRGTSDARRKSAVEDKKSKKDTKDTKAPRDKKDTKDKKHPEDTTGPTGLAVQDQARRAEST
jgi:hypothetical protein